VPTKIVPVTSEQLPALHETLRSAFGGEPVDEIDDRFIIEPERFFAVADGEQFVASAGAYSFSVTVPGGTALPVAGVTWVAVLPTHRRQGLLRKMMKHQLDDVAARGEAVAVLTASEGAIYSRFGYGVASQVASVELPRRAAFAAEPNVRGTFTVGGLGDERVAQMAAVYDRWCAQRPGAITRAPGVWKIVQLDREHQRFGGGVAYTVLHHDRSGAVDGYARYRYRSSETFNEKVVLVTECIAPDAEVEAALWRFLLDLDLTAKVSGLFQPIDDPLQWRLADPRAYRVKWIGDWLWARILDVPAALAARTYAREASVVLEVLDPFRPRGRGAGRFALDAGPDGVSCKRTKASPDVTLTVDVLGSLWLGAVPLSVYVRAGRANVSDPGVTLVVDELFRSSPMPFCNTPF
jgi:predicted acetyltransferase